MTRGRNGTRSGFRQLRSRRIARVGLATILVVLDVLIGAVAVEAQAPKVTAIDVVGNQRIEAETVRSYMLIGIGDELETARVDRSLKALFETGLFLDVAIRRQGTRLIVNVIENPIINQLAFEGNRRIDDETLSAEVQLRPRRVYTQTRIQNDVRRIVQLYRLSGRFAASVEPKVIQLPQNRVDLVFEINEGPQTAIRRITFIGNRAFSDSMLRSEIATKETRWYRFLTTDDTYDPDRLTLDRDFLYRFYRKNGYADFRINSAITELTPDREDFFITFSVEEGERYTFGAIEIETELRDLEPAQLHEKLVVQEGEIYDAEAVEDSIQNLTFELGRLGYAFVDVRPRAHRDREQRVLGITFEINEGPRVYVERIDIVGNVRTLDKVIRREFRLVEGDAYNAAKLRRSRQRVRGLGFFRTVDITREEGSAPDRSVINVAVEEQSTGELSVGAGFSTSDALIGDISVSERNLLGKGQELVASINISARRQFADISFTEPYFLDREVAAGFDVYRRRREFQDKSSFDLNSVGFKLRMGYPIAEHLRQSLFYSFDITDIGNTGQSSRFIRDQAGSATTSSVGYTLEYDARDDRLEPTAGYIVTGSQEVAGLGGNVNYLRSVLEYGHYFPIFEQVVGLLGIEQGYIFSFDDDVRIDDRFFVGGSNFRGFKVGGIGPRDKVTGDALGGNLYYVGVAEVRFPLGLPEEFGILGRTFTEIGSLAIIDESGPGIFDVGTPRVSAGVGFTWRSPFGPVQLDLALAVLQEDVDKTEPFRFSFGTRF